MNHLAIYQINAGGSDGADVLFGYHDKRISVSIFPGTPPPQADQPDERGSLAEDHLIDLLGRALSLDTDDDDKYEGMTDEALSMILDAGKALFAKMKPHHLVAQIKQDLHSLLHPEELFFRLLTVSAKPCLVPIDSKEAYTSSGASFDSNSGSASNTTHGLPQYSSKEILIEETFVQGAEYVVCRVLVDSRIMLCKAWKTGLSNPDLERELLKLQEVREANLHKHPPARVPWLLGYVTRHESDCVLGLLREWIPGKCLRSMPIPSILEGRRRKWAAQIRAAVSQLHEIGVIWGNGEAGNIIIDTADDAWLIDFGGGWTEGWVDEALADTVDGDEQAVERIMQFIEVR